MSKNVDEAKTCSVCGTALSGVDVLCPVCMLRKGLAGGVESGGSSASEDIVAPTPEPANRRFENYEIVKGEDGIPVELGRGAMGITYKAFDVDLRCLVTLKVITARYLNDESARLRFLREARAAASVRHPNVASVFHLGRTGENYFYAMEFVEGETLESLIQRSGSLEVNLALEISAQVAAGFGGDPRTEAGPPRYQTVQHHGECEGRKPRNREDNRLGSVENGRRSAFSARNFDARSVCRNAGIRQS